MAERIPETVEKPVERLRGTIAEKPKLDRYLDHSRSIAAANRLKRSRYLH